MTVLCCSGRPVDDTGTPLGEVCGRVFNRRTTGGWSYRGADESMGWHPDVAVDDVTYRNEARARGWAVGPNGEACCPSCRRPSPAVVRDCAEIARSVQR